MKTTTQSFSEACSTSVLRSTNAVFAVLCGVLVYEIIRFLGPNLSDRKATLMALVMSLYPLHWFFTFLYYTDVASLTAVLAMYLACLKKRFMLSALVSHLKQISCFIARTKNYNYVGKFISVLSLQFGTLAVFVRQTNVVWMLFVACSGIIDFTLDSSRQKEKQEVNQDLHQSIDRKGETLRSNLRKRKSDSSSDSRNRFNLGKMISSTEDTSGRLFYIFLLNSLTIFLRFSRTSINAHRLLRYLRLEMQA